MVFFGFNLRGQRYVGDLEKKGEEELGFRSLEDGPLSYLVDLLLD